jgi:hypothetical protein
MKLKELLPLINDKIEIKLWEGIQSLCYANSIKDKRLQLFLEREIASISTCCIYSCGIEINLKKLEKTLDK